MNGQRTIVGRKLITTTRYGQGVRFISPTSYSRVSPRTELPWPGCTFVSLMAWSNLYSLSLKLELPRSVYTAVNALFPLVSPSCCPRCASHAVAYSGSITPNASETNCLKHVVGYIGVVLVPSGDSSPLPLRHLGHVMRQRNCSNGLSLLQVFMQ